MREKLNLGQWSVFEIVKAIGVTVTVNVKMKESYCVVGFYYFYLLPKKRTQTAKYANFPLK